jgi:opacity protein-like surface antigen
MLSTRKAILVSAALILGGTQGALAADLYGGGSFKDAPVMAPMPAASAGWYVRVAGGYNLFSDPTIDVEGFNKTTNNSIDNSWSVGGGIGRYFGLGFRGDITVDHLFDAGVEGDINCGCGTYVGTAKFDFSSTVVLANLYYDFNRGGRFVPYIGAGIGFAHNETSSGVVDNSCFCIATIEKGSSNQFAAAGMAGVSWRLRGGETTYVGGLKDEPVAVNNGRALYLDVGYRFLYLGSVNTGDLVWASTNVGVDPKVKNITAQEVRVGLRYDLN